MGWRARRRCSTPQPTSYSWATPLGRCGARPCSSMSPVGATLLQSEAPSRQVSFHSLQHTHTRPLPSQTFFRCFALTRAPLTACNPHRVLHPSRTRPSIFPRHSSANLTVLSCHCAGYRPSRHPASRPQPSRLETSARTRIAPRPKLTHPIALQTARASTIHHTKPTPNLRLHQRAPHRRAPSRRAPPAPALPCYQS